MKGKHNKRKQNNKKRNAKTVEAGDLSVKDVRLLRAKIAEDEIREAKATAKKEGAWMATCEDSNEFFVLPAGHEAVGKNCPVVKLQGTFDISEGGSGFVTLNPFVLPCCTGGYAVSANYVTPCIYSVFQTSPALTGVSTIPNSGMNITGSTTYHDLPLVTKTGEDMGAPVSSADQSWSDDCMHSLPLKACIEFSCSTSIYQASGFIKARTVDAPATSELVVEGYLGMNDATIIPYDRNYPTPVNHKVIDAVEKVVQIKWFNGAKSSAELYSPTARSILYNSGGFLSAQWDSLPSNHKFVVTVSMWVAMFGRNVDSGPERPIGSLGHAIADAACKRVRGANVVSPNPGDQTSFWRRQFNRVIAEVSGPITQSFRETAASAVLALF